jgi:hypothetical protein
MFGASAQGSHARVKGTSSLISTINVHVCRKVSTIAPDADGRPLSGVQERGVSAANAAPALGLGLLGELLPANIPGQGLTGYPVWGGALIVVLGALALGSEYGWGTMKPC